MAFIYISFSVFLAIISSVHCRALEHRHVDAATVDLLEKISKTEWLFEQVRNLSKQAESREVNISKACLQDITTIDRGYSRFYEWAHLIRDSDGRRMSGLMWGAINMIGSYEQCVSVKATYTKWTTILDNKTYIHDFDARYCRSRIILCIFGAIVLLATVVDYRIQRSRRHIPKEPNTGPMVNGHVNQGCDARHVAETEADNATEIQDKNKDIVSYEAAIVNGDIPLKLSGTINIADVNENSRSNTHIYELPQGDDKVEEEPSKALQAFLAFSLYKSIPRVLSTKVAPGSYLCMNGIRFFSMTWIIMGHCFQLGIFVMSHPHEVVAENQWGMWETKFNHWHHAVIHEMSNSVESFFVLSASLVTVSFMKALDKQKGSLRLRQMVLYYFHRYWRLTPVLAIAIMFGACLYPLLRNGPLFPEFFYDFDSCPTSWWTNLLYLNNFLYLDAQCLGWTWYLANDFQFYVIAPVFIFVLYKWLVPGIIFLALGFCGHLAAALYINSEIVANDTTGVAWYNDYYIKPWCRFGSYAIGIGLGVILYKTRKSKVKIHPVLVVLGWALCAFLLLSSIYVGPNRGEWSSKAEWVAFDSTKRDTFALGMAWFIFACVNGYGGIINTLLSWRGFMPLARLTYIGYLIHVMLIYFFYYTSMRMVYVTYTSIVCYAGAVTFFTIGLSFVLTLVFEVPMMGLEKVIIPKPKQQ